MEQLEKEETEQSSQKGRSTSFRLIADIIQIVVLPLLLFFMIDSVVARVRVQKISMEPTLQPGEILLVNKMAYRFGEVAYGDIITFHYPLDPDLDYVKRVIGLPGDKVVVAEQRVYINGHELYEPYISAPPEYEGRWQVPADSLFVLGDNRNPSADSHVWGFVPIENVFGKALAVYWPPNHIRGLSSPDIFAPP